MVYYLLCVYPALIHVSMCKHHISLVAAAAVVMIVTIILFLMYQVSFQIQNTAMWQVKEVRNTLRGRGQLFGD